MRYISEVLLLAFLVSATSEFFISPLSAQEDSVSNRPNIVLVVVDDAALMDLGAYGGEASTPNIDALAARGAMFRQYRTSPLCSPTRAMLLTGLDNHLTGVATIPEVLPKEQLGEPGYTMSLEPNVLTIADRLRANGYYTFMAGKWHLGETKEELPQAHGFDRSFSLAASGADNWEEKAYIPYYQDDAWYENGEKAHLPEDFYSSQFIVDTAIDYLEQNSTNKPFFAYLPFQAVHIPVQAPREFIDKYQGRYDAGWHVLREKRHERAKALGLIHRDAALANLPPDLRDWESLSKQDQQLYADRMEVNAAMLDAMDHHFGRFVAHLQTTARYENTIFVITSDNGPEPSRGDESITTRLSISLSGYRITGEDVGGPRSWGFIGPEWASAAATPGAWFKFYATEGGVRAPLIMAGPNTSPMQLDAPAMVSDVTPTLLDWVGVSASHTEAREMTGRSLLPVLMGEVDSVYGPDEVRAIEVSGNTALYKGDFKITRSMLPVGDGKWRLFNLSLDPGETTDLSKQQPAKLQELLDSYDVYAKKMGVLEMPKGYDSLAQIVENSLAKVLKNYPWLYGLAALLLLSMVGLFWVVGRFAVRRFNA